MKPGFFFIVLLFTACAHQPVTDRTANFPIMEQAIILNSNKEKVWVFIMAGQSNMAGRGLVEPKDTLVNERILTINKNGKIIAAKEPLHFYEPELAGLDCGISFAQSLLSYIPADIQIIMVPTAVGGSAISQWLNDAVHRKVKLYSNFEEQIRLAENVGVVKAVLWHQGESDANPKDIPLYQERLRILLNKFRETTNKPDMPVLLGQLGLFNKNQEFFERINAELIAYSATDKRSAVISSRGLHHKGDSLHFNSRGQRLMGQRFAKEYAKNFLD